MDSIWQWLNNEQVGKSIYLDSSKRNKHDFHVIMIDDLRFGHCIAEAIHINSTWELKSALE